MSRNCLGYSQKKSFKESLQLFIGSLLLSVAAVIFFIVLLGITGDTRLIKSANAQAFPSNAVCGGSQYCVPSVSPILSPGTSPSGTQPNVNISAAVVSPVISQAPCTPVNYQSRDSRARPHHHHHHHGGGGGAISNLIQLLIQLIMQLLQMLGINTGGIGGIGGENGGNGGINPLPSTNPGGGINPLPSGNPCPPSQAPLPGTSGVPLPGVSTPVGSGSALPSPSGSSSASVTGCTQADIQKLVDSVSQDNITTLLKELVQDDAKPAPNELITRATGTAGNTTKTNWIKQTMDSYGYQSVLLPDSEGNSIVATLQGADPNSIYDVSSHLDSTSESPETAAPGADDNGSGTVAVMEAARVLKGLPASCIKYNIDFSPFNAEETSMGGSAAYVKTLSGKTFKGNFNMDMIGTGGGGIHANSNSTTDQPLRDKMVEVNTKYNIGATLKAGTGGSGVDSESFWGANMPSVSIEEETFSTVYHTTNDKTDKIDFAQITKTVKLIVGALAELETL